MSGDAPGSAENAPLQVHVVGIVQGKEVDSSATLELDGHTLVMVWSRAAPWRLLLNGIDGVAIGASQLTLYLASDDVLEITGDDRLRMFGSNLVERATAMPELTRGLRNMGSRRGALGASHDTWFAPLLNARRGAEGISDPLRQIAVLDARHLSERYASVIAELAAIQEPTDRAAQRAVEAILEEEAEPLFRAFNRAALAADALQGSAVDTRLLDWRRWIDTLQTVFVAADEAWGKMAGYVGPE